MRARMTWLYGTFVKGASWLQSPLLLLIRLYWGWQFAQTGWGKLQDPSKLGSLFTQLGIPLPHFTGFCIALLEFCGGILLGIGLASRPVAFALATNMLVAYILTDRTALTSFFSDPGKFYGADPFTFLAASLIVFVFGPGLFALDAFVQRRFLSKGHGNRAQ